MTTNRYYLEELFSDEGDYTIPSIGLSIYICGKCFSLVATESLEQHVRYHNELLD